MNFEDAYHKYLDFVVDRQKIQSVGTIKYKFKTCILPYFKKFDLYYITDLDYINWQHEINKTNYSNNYKKNLHYVMSGFFEFCVLFLGLKYNIAKKVGNFKMKNIKLTHDYYSLKEFKKFIKNVDNIIYKQFFNLMFFTGVRPGEAMALKFSDLKEFSLSINKTISEHSFDGERVVNDPKSLSSFRTIDIDKLLYFDLLKLKRIYDKKYNLSNFDYYIFGGIKPLAPTTINRYKKNACEKANLRPIKLHEFRHSHASLLYDKKIAMQDIKERLGHSDINITMSIYVHLNKKHKKRITRILCFLRHYF